MGRDKLMNWRRGDCLRPFVLPLMCVKRDGTMGVLRRGGKKGRREARLEEKESESEGVWDEGRGGANVGRGEERERRCVLCLRDGERKGLEGDNKDKKRLRKIRRA